MDHEIHSILERLRLIESDITPTNVKSGLNKQQQSVKQMPALFKPKTQKILGGDPNAKNPMSGYMVGGCEESEEMEEELQEDDIFEDKKLGEEASDDMLTKVKASFADYLQKLEDNIKQDKDLLAKKKEDFDLKKKKMKDLELQIKQKKEEAQQEEVSEDSGDDVSLRITFTPDDIEVIEDIIKKAKSIPSSGIFEHILDEYYAVAGEHAEDQQIQITLSNDDVDNIQGVINQFGKKLDATGILEHIMNEYQNVAGKEINEDHVKLEVGDEVFVMGHNEHYGEFGEIVEFAPSGKFVVVKLRNGDEASMHISDVEFHDDQEDVEDWEDDNKRGIVPEGDTYAQGGNNTYAECMMPVVKTVTFEDGSECTIHGDEQNGFIIRRGEKQLPSKFDHLDHATMALDMFRARQAAKNQADDSADYVEEK